MKRTLTHDNIFKIFKILTKRIKKEKEKKLPYRKHELIEFHWYLYFYGCWWSYLVLLDWEVTFVVFGFSFNFLKLLKLLISEFTKVKLFSTFIFK